MIRTALAAVALAAAALTATAAPAAALADDATDTPVVGSPIGVKPANDTGHVLIRVQGARHAAGLAVFAEDVDASLPGVRISTGLCSEKPKAVCVRVKAVDLGANGVYAQTWVWPTAPTHDRIIEVNTAQPHYLPEAVSAHEFMHALGMGHHASYGVVGGTPDVLRVSALEEEVLRATYSAQSIAARQRLSPRIAGPSEPTVTGMDTE